MNLDKLKETARRFEQKEDWRRAIEVYQRAIADLESQGDPIPDPSVYNRVGDLQMKVSDHQGAVRSYEHALELYADQGFFNNAIALGGKILRVDNTRTPVYLRLARLHARKNVVLEVRRHLEDYLARMRREHQLAKAVDELRSFVDKDCRDAEMRSVVTDLLAQAAPAGDPDGALDRLLEQLRARDDADPGGSSAGPASMRGLIFLDTDPSWDPNEGGAGIGAVEGLNSIEGTLPAALDGLPLVGLETSGPISADGLIIEHLGGVERDEVSFRDGPMPVAPDALIMLDTTSDDPAAGLVGGAEPSVESIPLISLESEGMELTSEGPLLDLESTPELRAVTIDLDPAPTDPLLAAAAAEAEAEAQAGMGSAPPAGPDPRQAVAQAEAALSRHEAGEVWSEALAAAAELVRLDPESIPRYQKQVELAYRAGDRDALTVRYLELGDALLRAGMRAPAVAVYRRVLEHHPGQGRALGALASLGVAVDPPGPPTAQPQQTDYVDLGALILDDLPARDSRMRVDSAEPSEPDNEDQTFREILEQFKRGIEDNLDSEDFQSHYDLGIAFKEMGLLDEAIAQFQRALRSPDGRLKASEALGNAFYEKGRHAIAEAVLSRAVAGLPGADDEKIGLIYWLGRALEAQGREADALPWYERALAVDIRFLDISERISRLGAGQGA